MNNSNLLNFFPGCFRKIRGDQLYKAFVLLTGEHNTQWKDEYKFLKIFLFPIRIQIRRMHRIYITKHYKLNKLQILNFNII